ncbi:MAG: hypothetical protein AAGC78_03235 [Cellvibrio sp.]|uniref:hypothetical protein n=1 Tax=Cellvibrio sp. TaxID=1965322 RepID=UPI0031A8AA02
MGAIVNLLIDFAAITFFIFGAISIIFIIVRYAFFLAKELRKGESALSLGFKAVKFFAVENAGGQLTLSKLFLISVILACFVLILIKTFG